MEHSRHLSRAISYTLGWQLAIKGLNSYCQIFLQWRQLILLWNFSYFKSIYWYCQIKGLGNFCDAFNTKCISLTCCCAVITLSSGRCMKRKAVSTISSWLNCALRVNEAVYWVIIGHYETVAVGNWWYWVSRGHLCLYILHKVEIWTGVTDASLTHSLTHNFER